MDAEVIYRKEIGMLYSMAGGSLASHSYECGEERILFS
jgi:hypothetical protein